jgi:putative phosphoesterase
MRIGILSDTHDQVRRTAQAVALLRDEGAEVLIHCGDMTGVSVVEECADLPSYFVFGNCDSDISRLTRAMSLIGAVCLGQGGCIELGGKRIAVTHGDSQRELDRLREMSPHYLFLGHSHLASDQRDGATRVINPGALHRASTHTVAVLDLETDLLRMLTIHDTR